VGLAARNLPRSVSATMIGATCAPSTGSAVEVR
jgi:hypothetical protein